LGEIRRTGSSGLLETRRYDLTGSVELLGDLRRRGQRRTAVRTKFAHRSVTPSSALLPADHEERFTTTSPVRRHTEYLRSTTDNVDLSPVSHARFLLRSSSHAATRSPRVPRRPRRPRCPRRPAVRPFRTRLARMVPRHQAAHPIAADCPRAATVPCNRPTLRFSSASRRAAPGRRASSGGTTSRPPTHPGPLGGGDRAGVVGAHHGEQVVGVRGERVSRQHVSRFHDLTVPRTSGRNYRLGSGPAPQQRRITGLPMTGPSESRSIVHLLPGKERFCTRRHKGSWASSGR